MLKYKIKEIIMQCLADNPCSIELRYDEPMRFHTTFKVGGPADCWVCPDGGSSPHCCIRFCAGLLSAAKSAGVPVFILGGGANIVVSDKGVCGIVLDMSKWKGVHEGFAAREQGKPEQPQLIFKSGASVDEACETAANAGFSGLEFLAGMPGTIGGAVFMNARCYGKEIADALSWAEVIINEQPAVNSEFVLKRVDAGQGFGYKQSPFQQMDCLILSAAFKLTNGDKDKIFAEMKKNKEDRVKKGHFLFPCAGSVFKNNYDFGKPSGQIIDELGLKGRRIGDAQIAPFHGNIIINLGNAAASDIRALVEETAEKVKSAAGLLLEPEILFVGEW